MVLSELNSSGIFCYGRKKILYSEERVISYANAVIEKIPDPKKSTRENYLKKLEIETRIAKTVNLSQRTIRDHFSYVRTCIKSGKIGSQYSTSGRERAQFLTRVADRCREIAKKQGILLTCLTDNNNEKTDLTIVGFSDDQPEERSEKVLQTSAEETSSLISDAGFSTDLKSLSSPILPTILDLTEDQLLGVDDKPEEQFNKALQSPLEERSDFVSDTDFSADSEDLVFPTLTTTFSLTETQSEEGSEKLLQAPFVETNKDDEIFYVNEKRVVDYANSIVEGNLDPTKSFRENSFKKKQSLMRLAKTVNLAPSTIRDHFSYIRQYIKSRQIKFPFGPNSELKPFIISVAERCKDIAKKRGITLDCLPNYNKEKAKIDLVASRFLSNDHEPEDSSGEITQPSSEGRPSKKRKRHAIKNHLSLST